MLQKWTEPIVNVDEHHYIYGLENGIPNIDIDS